MDTLTLHLDGTCANRMYSCGDGTRCSPCEVRSTWAPTAGGAVLGYSSDLVGVWWSFHHIGAARVAAGTPTLTTAAQETGRTLTWVFWRE